MSEWLQEEFSKLFSRKIYKGTCLKNFYLKIELFLLAFKLIVREFLIKFFNDR